MAGIDYVEVSLGGRTRKLRFGIATLRDLCLALGGITLVDLLQRLAGMDVNAVLTCIRYGLMHDDAKVSIRSAGEMLEAHIAEHGDASLVLTAISEALDQTGMISLRGSKVAPAGEAPGGPARD